MQDSAGKAGKVQQNRMDTEEDSSAFRTDGSQSSLYQFESSGHSYGVPGSPLSSGSTQRVPEPPSQPVEDLPEYQLPQRYDETVLSLLVRDPYWIYAYWSISQNDVYRVCRDHGQDAWAAGAKLLRVYDVTEGSIDQSRVRMDIGIGDSSTSWYISVPMADRRYCADIVLVTPSGREITLARSNVVSTPRDGISDVIDEEWMVLKEFDKLYWMSAGFGPSSPEFQKRFRWRSAQRRVLMGSQLLAAGFSPGGAWGTTGDRRHVWAQATGTNRTAKRGRADEKIT